MKEGLVAVGRKLSSTVDFFPGVGEDWSLQTPNFLALERITGGISHGKNETRCPSCNSIIYSRRHKLCGVCGEHLPEYCLFSSIQARNVAQRIEEERQRHRAWLRKANELSC